MSKFKDYWLATPTSKRKEFAERCGTSANYLNMIAHGQKSPNETLTLNIEIQSRDEVTVADQLPEFAALLTRAGYKKTRRSRQ